MQGISERQYAARVGLARGAMLKAKAAGRLVRDTHSHCHELQH